MPNWCRTSLVFEGDKNEIEALHSLMEDLGRMDRPKIENSFGTRWLGSLVDALGGDWKQTACRGSWSDLELDDCTLSFTTGTAWSPCLDTYDFICSHFPSLTYYYQAEESGELLYQTNDVEGKYFPDRFHVEMCTPDEEEYQSDYFMDLSSALAWISKVSGSPIQTVNDVRMLNARWNEANSSAYCYLNEFKIV